MVIIVTEGEISSVGLFRKVNNGNLEMAEIKLSFVGAAVMKRHCFILAACATINSLILSNLGNASKNYRKRK
jgi:hypothetical protein